MASNVISQPIGAIVKLNTITKIRKYRVLHEGHHFILMAMKMHITLKCDMLHLIKECDHLFHDK